MRDSYDQPRRCSSATHPDLNWFRRERACLACKHEFSTAEVYEAQLLELLRRDAVLAAFEQLMRRIGKKVERAIHPLPRPDFGGHFIARTLWKGTNSPVPSVHASGPSSAGYRR